MDDNQKQPFDWNETYTGELDDVQEPDAQLMKIVGDLAPGRALDMGCGAGGTVAALAELGWRVTGVDIAPRAIEAATKFLASRNLVAELHVSDAVGFEPGSRYDLVLSSFALPATEEDQRKFYRLVTSCLAPGGTVLIKDFDASMGRLEVFQSFHCPTLDEFRRAFDGLEIQTCEIVDTDRGDGGDIPWTAAVFQARS